MRHQEYIHSEDWKRLRMAAIRRDRYKCRCCNKQCDENGAGLQVHHIRYPKDFNDDYLGNLITLCKRHHAYRHGFSSMDPVHIGPIVDSVMQSIERTI